MRKFATRKDLSRYKAWQLTPLTRKEKATRMSCDEATAVDDNNSLKVELVTSLSQFPQIFAIRSACYMDDIDTKLPFDEAFDGNDFQATHVIACLGNEPIGALRIRWFANFAKIERTGFRLT